MKIIGIIGAGTMGMGIAQAAALAKYDVLMYDVNDTILRQATERIKAEFKRSVQKGKVTQEQMLGAMDHIKSRTNLPDMGHCDLIIEAVVEDLRVKRDLFRRLDDCARAYTILATNTSSLPVTQIAAATKKPERVIGLHFFNPAHIMKLVEVIPGARTNEDTTAKAEAFVRMLGKTPVMVKDTPGFIVNRIARPFYGEALRLLGERAASVEVIDRIAREIGGFPMGPFELMDTIGIDINLSVTQSMYDQFGGEPRYRPHPIQKQMLEAGTVGKKSKKGFYNYELPDA